MADDTLNVRFGDVSRGWLPVTFSLAGTDVAIDASDVPTDPIVEVVSLARFLLSSEAGSRSIEFHLEPEHCVVTATKTEPDVTDIRVVQPGCDVLASQLSRVKVATQIWRALRGVESALRSATENGEWSWEFPSTQMEMLTREIDRAKLSSGLKDEA